MRIRLVASTLLVLCCTYSVAQTPAVRAQQDSQPATKLEAFLGKKGRLVVKEFYPLSSVSRLGKVEGEGLVIYEPGANQKTKGLRIEVTESGRLERSNTSFIDLEELQGLSDALGYMSNVAEKWKAESHDPYTELVYSSKGELNVGFYQKGKESSFFVTSGRIGSVTAYLHTPDLQAFKGIVDKAIVLLNSK